MGGSSIHLPEEEGKGLSCTWGRQAAAVVIFEYVYMEKVVLLHKQSEWWNSVARSCGNNLRTH